MAEQKIPVTARLTQRQASAVKAEADRLDISESDVLRRVVDNWMERREDDQRRAHPLRMIEPGLRAG